MQLSAEERRRLRTEEHPDGFDIYEEDIYDFLRWKSSHYSGQGTTGEPLRAVLIQQLTQFCEHGTEILTERDRSSGRSTTLLLKRGMSEARRTSYQRNSEIWEGVTCMAREYQPATKREKSCGRSSPSSLNTISYEAVTKRLSDGLERDGFEFDARTDRNSISRSTGGGLHVRQLWERSSVDEGLVPQGEGRRGTEEGVIPFPSSLTHYCPEGSDWSLPWRG